MRNTPRFLALTLVLAMLLPACAQSDGGSPGETTADKMTNDTAVSTETTELLRENTPDNLPDDLTLNGRTIRFAVRDVPDYVMDIECDDSGDIVESAIYERNLAVSERLDVNIQALPISEDPNIVIKAVRTSVQANSNDYDIVAGVQSVTLPLAVQNCYLNLQDAPYIDLEQPWWWTDYIDELRVGNHAYFFLDGDISVFGIKSMSAIFFNKRLLDDIGMKYEELYRIVLDGEWTYEKFLELGEKAYNDINGDGVRDEGDCYGFLARKNTEPEHFYFTTGLHLTERDENNYPVLNMNTEMHQNVVEMLYRTYFENDAIYITGDENLMISKFAEGTSLFLVNRFVALKNLRDMGDEYGVIPFPKLTVDQDHYEALLHDNTTIYSVPIIAEDSDEICAVLEAMCAQNYRTVIPAFYETALKVKYQSDSTAGQVIDMIRDGARTDFAYAYNYTLNGVGNLSRTLVAAKSSALATYLAKLTTPGQKALNELIQAFETAE